MQANSSTLALLQGIQRENPPERHCRPTPGSRLPRTGPLHRTLLVVMLRSSVTLTVLGVTVLGCCDAVCIQVRLLVHGYMPTNVDAVPSDGQFGVTLQPAQSDKGEPYYSRYGGIP